MVLLHTMIIFYGHSCICKYFHHDYLEHYQDVQNELNNIFFGPELNEIQPISLNSLKLALSPSILGHFGCSWTYFEG